MTDEQIDTVESVALTLEMLERLLGEAVGRLRSEHEIPAAAGVVITLNHAKFLAGATAAALDELIERLP